MSISVAAYNVEDVLENCLDSLARSRYLADIEVLIINDGSKDNTENIANKYQKKYPKSFILVNKKNGGHGSTINESIKRAQGKYFKILDGDDWVDVEEFDGFIEELFSCRADLMINDFNEVYKNKIVRRKVVDSYNLNTKNDIQQMNLNNIFPMHSITVRTNKLRQENFRMSSNRFYADTEYVFLVFLVTKTFQVSDKCVYQYRLGVDGQSVSSIGVYNHIEDMIYIENRLLEEYITHIKHPNTKILKMFVQKKYIAIFNMFVIMCKNDKICQLRYFDTNMRKKYPEFIREIPLGKYAFVRYNYLFFINLYRVLYRISSMIKTFKSVIIHEVKKINFFYRL